MVALRIAREPHQLRQLIDGARQGDTNAPLPPGEEVPAVRRVENVYRKNFSAADKRRFIFGITPNRTRKTADH